MNRFDDAEDLLLAQSRWQREAFPGMDLLFFGNPDMWISEAQPHPQTNGDVSWDSQEPKFCAA